MPVVHPQCIGVIAADAEHSSSSWRMGSLSYNFTPPTCAKAPGLAVRAGESTRWGAEQMQLPRSFAWEDYLLWPSALP